MAYQIRKMFQRERNLIEELKNRHIPEQNLYWDNEFIVAEKDKGIAGAISYYFDGRYYQIQHFFLDKNSHRRIGLKMLKQLENNVLNQGHNEVVSYVENTNNPLQLYLQRLGFKAYDNDAKGVWFFKILKQGDKNG